MTATPTVSALAVWAYLRPRAAVRSCYVDQNGAITLIRRDVAISFDLTWYRYVRMYNNQAGRMTYPSTLVLYRDTPPTMWTWMGSVLFPRVDDARVVLFFNRWWDVDGYFVAPGNLAASGWEVRDDMRLY